MIRKAPLSRALLIWAVIPLPAAAQDSWSSQDNQEYPQPAPSPLPSTNPGEVAQSSVGQAGQRRTREDLTPDNQIVPMTRISSRIQNRVQARIRNRIDRFYDPKSNATSPFAIAGEQVSTPQRR